MADKIFVEGMYFEKPNDKAPEFVKGKISVNALRFYNFMEKHKNGGGYVNIDLKKSREGKYYLELNTYQPKKEYKEPEIVLDDESPF